MQMLSIQRRLPPLNIRMPIRFSRSVQTKDVNCEPHDLGRAIAVDGVVQRLDARQLASGVFDMRQASTLRVNKSMMTTRYRNEPSRRHRFEPGECTALADNLAPENHAVGGQA